MPLTCPGPLRMPYSPSESHGERRLGAKRPRSALWRRRSGGLYGCEIAKVAGVSDFTVRGARNLAGEPPARVVGAVMMV